VDDCFEGVVRRVYLDPDLSGLTMSSHPALGVMTAEEEDRANVALNFLNRYVPMAWNHFLYCRENAALKSVVARAKANRDLVLVLDAALFLEAAADHYNDAHQCLRSRSDSPVRSLHSRTWRTRGRCLGMLAPRHVDR